MIRCASFFVAAVLWTTSTALVLAQSDPLEVVPDDVLGFAVIHDLTDANERVSKLTQRMQLPLPDLLGMIKGYVGVQEGIDEKGGLAFVAVSGPEGEEAEGMAFLTVVPTSDYAALVKPLDPVDADAEVTKVTVAETPMYVGHKGNFAVFASEAGKEQLKTFLNAESSVKTTIEPLKDWLAEHQAAIVVTPRGKTLLFQSIAAAIPDTEQLKRDAGVGEDGADDDKAEDGDGEDGDGEPDDDAPEGQPLGGPAAIAQPAPFEAIGQMFGGFKTLLLRADEQVTHLAAGVRIEDNATLHVTARAVVKPGGALAEWAKDVKVPAEGLLAGVPEGKYVFAYGGVSAQFSPEVWALLGQFSDVGMQMMGLDEEGRKEYTLLAEKLQQGKRFTSGVMGTMRPGDSFYTTTISIEHVESADEHLQLTRKSMTLLESALKAPGTDEPMYRVQNAKVGDIEALEIITDLSAMTGLQEEAGPGGAQMQDIFGQMFGREGKIHMYVAKASDKIIVTAYSREQLVRGVDHVRSGKEGLAASADVAKTTALLPPGSQWVAYVDPQGLMQLIGTFVAAFTGGEAQFPAFPATEPIGLAARASETALDVELVLPDNVVAGIGVFVFAIGQMFQGGGPLP